MKSYEIDPREKLEPAQASISETDAQEVQEVEGALEPEAQETGEALEIEESEEESGVVDLPTAEVEESSQAGVIDARDEQAATVKKGF